jgi:large subunit ribosomal protein L25
MAIAKMPSVSASSRAFGYICKIRFGSAISRARPFPTPLEARAQQSSKDIAMAEAKQLAAAVRDGTGKGAARSVRREGRIPGVIYGGGEPAQPISLDHKTLNHLIYQGKFLTTIFEIDVEGQKQRTIPRDYQLDVVKDTPLHVDFLRLKPGTRIRVDVPVRFINHEAAPGLKRGGSINVVRHTVEMQVPADNIPDSLTADLTGLDFNDSLHISAIKLPEGCTPTIRDRDFTVVTLAPPSARAEDTPAPAAAAGAAAAPGVAAPAAGATPAAAAAPAAGAKAAPAKDEKKK